jgi:membrane protease YdiL (CAAX protease family)
MGDGARKEAGEPPVLYDYGSCRKASDEDSIETMAINYLGYLFIFINCILWPLRSYIALQKHPIGQPISTPKAKRYAVGITLTLLQTGFALWTAFDNHLAILGPFSIDIAGIVATLIFLTITLGTLPWLVQRRSAGWKMRFYSILPTTTREKTAWVFICIIVAVGEETIYRAVTLGIFYRLTGSYWIGAIIAAAVFALNHLVQGWISTGTILVIGLGFHLLVRITGGLYAAIAAHFLYDLLAGIIYGRIARRESEKTDVLLFRAVQPQAERLKAR